MRSHATPRVITLDAYAASHRAIRDLKSAGVMPARVRIRSSEYLNNVVEQDHRRIKHRIRPMLGFKRFETATITISGIELAEKIRKHQFKTGKLSGRPTTAPDIWRLFWLPDAIRSRILSHLTHALSEFAPEPFLVPNCFVIRNNSGFSPKIKATEQCRMRTTRSGNQWTA
jgi:hypothetical protein